MPFSQLLLAQQVPLVSLGAAGLFSQPSGTLETAHAVPKGDFCLQGQFWCHWSPGEKGGLAATGLGCSSWGTYVPPSQADSGLGFYGWHLPSTGRALAVQGTEHLRGKQSWGCSVFRDRLQKDPFGRDSELFQLCQNEPVGCEGVGQSGRFLVPKGSWQEQH